ncbi:hypothetical protein AMTRI_Chr10g970 [Amborella trichopoda]
MLGSCRSLGTRSYPSSLTNNHVLSLTEILCKSLRCFTLVSVQEQLKPVEIDQNRLVSMLGSCKNVESLKKLHAQFLVLGFSENLFSVTKMLTMYFILGSWESGRLIFNHIKNPDLYSWKLMLGLYLTSNLYSELLCFYRSMKVYCLESDNRVFAIVLRACSELRSLNVGREIHSQIIKMGNPDSFIFSGLINLYMKCSIMDDAKLVFDEMPEKNVVAWTSMIAGFLQNEAPEESLVFFNPMQRAKVKPNQFTMVSLLSGCSRLNYGHQGKWVHCYMIKTGLNSNSFTATALLDMYSKCGTLIDACAIFDDMHSTDVVSWTAMISGYTQKGSPFDALKLFREMRRLALLPNSLTIASVLSACAKLGSPKQGLSIHKLVIMLGLEGNLLVRNALIDMYGKCGMIDESSCIFESIQEKDLVTWNSMISGYSQLGFGHEALVLFQGMRSNDVLPDPITMVSVILACSWLGSLKMGESFHGFSTKAGFLLNVYVGTSLIDLYAKCGYPKVARSVFNEMREKNIVSYSAMISGYGIHGDAENSLSLLRDLEREKLQPNDIIFTGILAACSHKGLVTEGRKCFNRISRDYGISPSMKHYACMVDLLGRAGKLNEALEFITKMPIKPQEAIWGALLHACRLHMDVEIAEIAANQLFDLKSETPGYYVLMSNIYAEAGRWDGVKMVREMMGERRVRKLPGWSSIEVENRVHSFTVGDASSPLTVQIHDVLERLSRHMEETMWEL